MSKQYQVESQPPMNQTQYVKFLANDLMEQGYADKKGIYTMIVNKGIPRPTVRRICNELVKDMQKKVEILSPITNGGKKIQ